MGFRDGYSSGRMGFRDGYSSGRMGFRDGYKFGTDGISGQIGALRRLRKIDGYETFRSVCNETSLKVRVRGGIKKYGITKTPGNERFRSRSGRLKKRMKNIIFSWRNLNLKKWKISKKGQILDGRSAFSWVCSPQSQLPAHVLSPISSPQNSFCIIYSVPACMYSKTLS